MRGRIGPHDPDSAAMAVESANKTLPAVFFTAGFCIHNRGTALESGT